MANRASIEDKLIAEVSEILEVPAEPWFDKANYAGIGRKVINQLPIAKWHEYIAEPTLADAIIDRLMANAHRFELKGESLRKKVAKKSPKNKYLRASNPHGQRVGQIISGIGGSHFPV